MFGSNSASPAAPEFPRLRHLPLHKRRFAILFFFLLASIVVYPYAETSRVGYYAFRTLGSAIILLTIWAVTFRRHLVILVLCLAVPALLQHFFLSPSHSSGGFLFNGVLSLGFDVVVIGIIYRAVYSDHQPTSETIFGALCVYLLLGFAFASVYGLIAGEQPGAFYLDPATNSLHTLDRFDLVYFSFGTMTELGTPGITAVSREVRSVSILEAVLGILYLAVLISRIMSTYRSVSAITDAHPHPHPPIPTSGPELSNAKSSAWPPQ